MISDKDLEKWQDEQEKLMTDTVYVQRITRTTDSAGGASESWATQATVSGRLALASGREQIMADRLGAVITHVATLPHDTDVLQGDQLQIDSVQYHVESVLKRTKQSALRVLCVELQ